MEIDCSKSEWMGMCAELNDGCDLAAIPFPGSQRMTGCTTLLEGLTLERELPSLGGSLIRTVLQDCSRIMADASDLDKDMELITCSKGALEDVSISAELNSAYR